ncbi:MAG TPA: transcriptional regulator [Pyrinomonadaceae bacterium]|jgi:DNA-binding winged helix-turn-helix (wHTH) protein|nr:transcriptional regulator [Pyrinomonadaceae bacterium]
MNQHLLRCYEFGPFCLNATDKLLHRADKVVALTPKLVDILVLLVENSGHVVTKEELLQTLWPDSFVEESSLTQNISLLRKALAENGSPQYIETIPKRGYRFVAVVREVSLTPADLLRQETSDVHLSGPDLTAAPVTHPISSRTVNRNAYLAIVALGVVAASVIAIYFCSGVDRPTEHSRLNQLPLCAQLRIPKLTRHTSPVFIFGTNAAQTTYEKRSLISKKR